MAQPSLLYLTECPPQHLPFRFLVGNKGILRVWRVEEENLEFSGQFKRQLPSSTDSCLKEVR